MSYSSADLFLLSERVKSVIGRGGVVAIPTETFYGLAVDPFKEEAVERLLRIKDRDRGKPVLVVIGALKQLEGLVESIPPAAKSLMQMFWPGPLTMIFPAKAMLPNSLTAGTGTVGIRLSSCGPLAELLKLVGPLTGTSANRADRPPARTAQIVEACLRGRVDLIVDAGPAPGGLPSTVIDVRDPVRIVREGAVTRAQLEQILTARGISLV